MDVGLAWENCRWQSVLGCRKTNLDPKENVFFTRKTGPIFHKAQLYRVKTV